MKTATTPTTQERFFLYWKNYFQPAGFFAPEIKKYIRNCLLFGAKVEEFKLSSNFADDINVAEFINS